MEKYCYWEYLDGTVGAGGFEVHFRVPATRRFSKLVGEQPPRIVDINQVLQAYCNDTPELAPILTGTIYIETEQEWKWLNSVLAQHLYSSRLIPAGRSAGAVNMFPLGEYRLGSDRFLRLTRKHNGPRYIAVGTRASTARLGRTKD